ncbi:hypothetical protein Y1Q_0001051 [Alligator mississippiensis]|uniref:Uncharacterized protein n=1 Tax=Alligator mississippiensis TaxID=8496 RepID=A0A151NEC4_ALLMI|nr:hypothetical protein Y1Q_0001051 [Alligator mississippiensis]
MFAGSGYNTEGNWTLSIFKFVEQSSIMLQGPDHQKNKTQEMTDEITNTVMGCVVSSNDGTQRKWPADHQDVCREGEEENQPHCFPDSHLACLHQEIPSHVVFQQDNALTSEQLDVVKNRKNVEEPALALEAQTAGIYTDTVQAWDTEDSLYTCELETMSEDTGKKDPPIPEEMGVHTAGISKKTVLLF